MPAALSGDCKISRSPVDSSDDLPVAASSAGKAVLAQPHQTAVPTPSLRRLARLARLSQREVAR